MDSENTLMPTQSVDALGPDNKAKPKEKSPVTAEQRLKFISSLEKFITGRTDNEDEQKEMLDVATEQFKGAPIHLIKENCNKCYGRGFTAYNKSFKYYTMCTRCFKFV